MKRKNDPRHLRRRQITQELYALSFKNPHSQSQTTQKITSKLKEIDKIIEKCAAEWPIEKINKVDLAILRLAVFELFFEKKVPPKVIIDEAVELAKEFGSESSPGFINGVLGTAIKNRDHE